MTLRIFEVSSDGVAVAVSKEKEQAQDRELPAQAKTSTAPARPERWAGSSEWDELRSRLREAEPRVEPPTRRRR